MYTFTKELAILLEAAIGDAFGAGFEYADQKFVGRHIHCKHYIQHPRHKLVPGSYTDDTQMSIAIAEFLLSEQEWTPLNLANKFVEVFKRDQRKGYSRNFYSLLCKVESGAELLALLIPQSERNGAAMRSVPLGCLPIAEALKYAAIQAAITHNTDVGIKSSQAVALMSSVAHRVTFARAALPSFLNLYVPIDKNWNEPWQGAVGGNGIDTVRAALTAIIMQDSLNGILQMCIGYTGDVDTVATIALGVASGFTDVKKDLPLELFENLENGMYGREFIVDLDNRLKRFRCL